MTNDTSETTYVQAELAADIVVAYISNNVLSAKDLPALIRDVHAALAGW